MIFVIGYLLLSIVIGAIFAWWAKDSGLGMAMFFLWPIMLPLFSLFSLYEAIAKL